MAAADRELGLAGLKSYAWRRRTGLCRSSSALFDARRGRVSLAGVIEADALGQRRTGAASGVAAKHLALRGRDRCLGVIGCGWQARSHRSTRIRDGRSPRSSGSSPPAGTPERLRAFCKPRPRPSRAESHQRRRRPGRRRHRDHLTPDPVLRGEWLREGALVCAIGANDPRARELDNVVLERATFVCCDSREQARLESGDLIDPVAGGVLDWLEVHELQEVVAGELPGRRADADLVLFKSNGLAAWDVAIGRRRARARARARRRDGAEGELGLGRAR